MTTVKNKKKDEQSPDILESSEALREQLTKTEQFLEQHKLWVFSIVGAVLLAAVGYFLFRFYVHNQDAKAQVDMFQAVYYFEAEDLDKALQGDGNNFGFLEIIDEYPMTKSAKLAQFYAGACYLKKAEFDNAIEYLSKYTSNDVAIQARAFSLTGDAYMEKADYSKAAEFYLKAAEFKANEFLSPQYLVKAAVAYEKLMNFESAAECYGIIVEQYNKSGEFQNAQKNKARLEGLAKK